MTEGILRFALRFLTVSLCCQSWSIAIGATPIEREINNNDRPETVVVFTDGQVSVKRKGWTTFAPAVFGSTINLGDLLRVGENSHAKVVCSDLTLHDVHSGTVGAPCYESRTRFLRTRDGSLVNVTRSSPVDPLTPLVLSPRRTKLLSSTPMLRWTAVPGSVTYRVIVRGMNFFWATRVSSQTEITYPEWAPKLEQGVDYKLIVEAGGRSSSAEPGFGLGFSVMGSNEKKVVTKAVDQIKRLGLPNGPTQYLIARLYAGYGLNAEAVQMLERVSADFKAAAVSRLLGDLYRSVGLARQAENSYLNSLSFCKAQNDQEGEMLVHLALASIYGDVLGNDKLAHGHLDAAITLANFLGDKRIATQGDRKSTE